MARSTDGFLFPSEAELNRLINLDSSSAVQRFKAASALGYQTYEAKFKSTAARLTRREGPFGTHSARKTFYLLGIFAGVPRAVLQYNARHLTTSNADLYCATADNLKETSVRNNRPMDKVPHFEPILCREFQMTRRAVGLSRFTTLDFVAKTFIEK